MFDDNDDFEEFSDENDEEINREIAENKRILKSHPLIIQSKVIYEVVNALIDSDDISDSTFLDSAMIIQAKLHGAITSNSYVICMQNASIIRDHAQYLLLANHHLARNSKMDSQYITILREEMEKFRQLFKLWAFEIHKMEPDFIDEDWGLFIK